ncbi:hypothetical protein ACX16W_22875 [Bacillus cereus]
MTVKVIDAICGAGKTSYAIQYMNEHKDKLFIYVTPFLTEVERIKEQTIQEFFEPNAKYCNLYYNKLGITLKCLVLTLGKEIAYGRMKYKKVKIERNIKPLDSL